ncbi:uncharacterized protein LOC119075020 [Bradysia coprophila]|uniref:uncharacterized protein LOC119075020 n=1 Tax=Bradysia coprophila TaxID=38358 RepID=UPI00187DD2A8|nr:uncharacterized protein LOC119075020 [Bradysia coprophila]
MQTFQYYTLSFTGTISKMELIHLTTLILFVLQSRNAYELDSDDPFAIDNDDFKMEIDGATAVQIANLDIDDISFEDNINTFPTTQPQPTPPPQYETFLLKKTINPAMNNHIQTNNNLQSMKAYKIVSKKPIIENSLVKIVMAPHNVLEKLSRQDQRNNIKYVIDTIDKSGNAPIKENGSDGIYGRELIQNGNGNGNINVEVFSLEDDGSIDFTKTTQNVLDHDFNNIQVIAKPHKQQLNTISMEKKSPFELIEIPKVGNVPDPNKSEGVINPRPVDLETKSMETIPESKSSHTRLPITTEAIVTDSTYADAEELLSNPTTSQNLIPTLTPELEDMLPDSVEDPTDTNASTHRIGLEDVELLPITSTEVSAENGTPTVVLKILKNRTVLIEETVPQSTPDQLGMEMTSVPKIVTPVVRPKKKTSTEAPIVIEVKPPQFPVKTAILNTHNKHKNVAPKLDDISFELTGKTSLQSIETTEVLPLSLTKSKNKKRAVGDEGSFASNIVRPSPIRPKKIGDLFPHETEAERAERLSKSMQRLMHFVTIVGHVDSYLTKRVRHGLKNVARIFDSAEDTRRRRSNL